MTQLILLLGLIPFCYGAAVEDTFASCFNRTTRRSIDNYSPIAEYTRITAVQCMNFCVVAADNDNPVVCRSFTHDRISKKCSLYDHDGTKMPAIVYPANDIDLYVRKSTQGACGGLLSTHPQMHIKNKNRLNFQVLREQEEEDSDGFDRNQITDINQSDRSRAHGSVQISAEESAIDLQRTQITPGVHDGDMFTKSVARTRSVNPKEVTKPSSSFSSSSFKSSTVSPRELGHSFERPEELATKVKTHSTNPPSTSPSTKIDNKCSNGEGYYVVLGNQIVAPSGLKSKMKSLEDVDQGDCARLCILNKMPNGNDFDCHSINYYPSKRRCEMFSILSEPHGPGNLLENRNSIYAEKFCISEAAEDCEPEEVFILHVQKTFRSKPQDTVSGDSITSCLDRCFGRSFCRSVVFDSTKRQCRQHSQSPGDDNTDVIDASPGVVLIENGCRRNEKPIEAPKSRGLSHKLAKNSIRRSPKRNIVANNVEFEEAEAKEQSSFTWTEWSDCTFKSRGKRFRVRSKNCDNDNEECRDNGLELKSC